MNQVWLSELIKKRRTRKPTTFHSGVPNSVIRELIDAARYAPNHHRTEPARFYLLNSEKIKDLARLHSERIRAASNENIILERAKKKEAEWRRAPGILVITSFTDPESALFQKVDNLIEENYASTCCIVQNLLLLFECSQISSKWSTARVWKDPKFGSILGTQNLDNEKFVGLIFYGLSDTDLGVRALTPLHNQLIDYTEEP